MARKHNCQGMVCGHIHVVADKMIEDIRYLNSGDWIESLTGIVERANGEIQVINYKEFKREFN